MAEKIIGIDLGTTNSVVAVVENGEPVVIPNAEGNRTTPSVVAFTDSGERLVGLIAKRQAITNPTRTIYSAKRFIGRRYDEVQSEIPKVPYKVDKDEQNRVVFVIEGKRYLPQEISMRVLQKMKQSAEDYLGHPVQKAVITVPAYFNDAQRQATTEAGRIAGLEVMRIINEPTAAAIAYGLDKKGEETVAVFDFGGGTFDISILELGSGVFEVKATNGDTHLGGDDIDQIVMDWIAEQFKKDQGIDLRKDPMAVQRLKEAAEKAKCELSSAQSTSIDLPFITADASGPKHLKMELSRSQFERLIADLVERVVAPCQAALRDANMKPSDIKEVVLVGGSTRIPLVQQRVKELFGKEPNRSVNPDEVVAVGAAIYGSVLAGEETDLVLVDVTPISLGIETLGDVFTRLIERNTAIPVERKQIFSTAEDNQSAVTIKVYQGERDIASRNRLLGMFNLDNIPPAPRGVPQIEVKFSIDANGILHVTARDLATAREQSVRIESSVRLSEEEIERMVKDAEKHAAEDKKAKEEAELRNEADALAYNIEKQLNEHGDKLDHSLRDQLEKSVQAVKDALERKDPDAIRRHMAELKQLAPKIGQALYERTGATSGAEGATSSGGKSPGGDKNTVDAEFEEVDTGKQ